MSVTVDDIVAAHGPITDSNDCEAAPEPFVEIRESAQTLGAIKSALKYFGEPGTLDLARRGAD